jgi:hypothetical protein
MTILYSLLMTATGAALFADIADSISSMTRKLGQL